MQKGIKWNNVYNSYCTNFTDKKITTQILPNGIIRFFAKKFY